MGNKARKVEDLTDFAKKRYEANIIEKKIEKVENKLEEIREVEKALNLYSSMLEEAKKDVPEMEVVYYSQRAKNSGGVLAIKNPEKYTTQELDKLEMRRVDWNKKIDDAWDLVRGEVEEAAKEVGMELKKEVALMENWEMKNLLKALILKHKENLEIEKYNHGAQLPKTSSADYLREETVLEGDDIKEMRLELGRLEKFRSKEKSGRYKGTKLEKIKKQIAILEAKLGSKSIRDSIKDKALLKDYDDVFTEERFDELNAEIKAIKLDQKYEASLDIAETTLIQSLAALFQKQNNAISRYEFYVGVYDEAKSNFEKVANKYGKGIKENQAKKDARDKAIADALGGFISTGVMLAMGPSFTLVQASVGEVVKAGFEEAFKQSLAKGLDASLKQASAKVTVKPINEGGNKKIAKLFKQQLHDTFAKSAGKIRLLLGDVLKIREALLEMKEQDKWKYIEQSSLENALSKLKNNVKSLYEKVQSLQIMKMSKTPTPKLLNEAEQGFWAAWLVEQGLKGNPLPKKEGMLVMLNDAEEKELRRKENGGPALVLYTYLAMSKKIKLDKIGKTKALSEYFKTYYNDIWGWFLEWAKNYDTGKYWKEVLTM